MTVSKNMKVILKNTKVRQLRNIIKSWDAPERRHEAPQAKNTYGSGLFFLNRFTVGWWLGRAGESVF